MWFLWLHTYWSLHSFFVSSSPEKQKQQESERESTPSCICGLSDIMHAFVMSHESKGVSLAKFIKTNSGDGTVELSEHVCVHTVVVVCRANNDYINISIPENKRQWESESSQGYSPLSPPHTKPRGMSSIQLNCCLQKGRAFPKIPTNPHIQVQIFFLCI